LQAHSSDPTGVQQQEFITPGIGDIGREQLDLSQPALQPVGHHT